LRHSYFIFSFYWHPQRW